MYVWQRESQSTGSFSFKNESNLTHFKDVDIVILFFLVHDINAFGNIVYLIGLYNFLLQDIKTYIDAL